MHIIIFDSFSLKFLCKAKENKVKLPGGSLGRPPCLLLVQTHPATPTGCCMAAHLLWRIPEPVKGTKSVLIPVLSIYLYTLKAKDKHTQEGKQAH